MNPIEQIITDALAYTKAVQAEAQAAEANLLRQDAERFATAKADILSDLSAQDPLFSASAAYVELSDLTFSDALKRANAAYVLMRLPSCDLIGFGMEWRQDSGWIIQTANGTFRVYPDVEAWWECDAEAWDNLQLAIASARTRSNTRKSRMALEALEAKQREREAHCKAYHPVPNDMCRDYLLTIQTLSDGGQPLPLGACLHDHIRGLLNRLRQYELLHKQQTK
jgi:hypothetical protein